MTTVKKSVKKKTTPVKAADVFAKAKSYVGIKKIDAVPMNRGSYNRYRGWDIPKNEDPKDKGFMVRYPDGYISWSPEKQFVEAYMTSGEMSFAVANYLMDQGYKMARKGWNGKKMWVSLSPGSENLPASRFWNKNNKEFAKSNGGKADVLPCYTMKTADGKILMGWLASQSDMAAKDWCIVD